MSERSSLTAQHTKDLVLSLKWLGLLLWRRFNHQPRNFHVLQAQPQTPKIGKLRIHKCTNTEKEKNQTSKLNPAENFLSKERKSFVITKVSGI